MRLLNAKTLVLEEYFDRYVPPYAILSHRWGEGEVSFQDIQGPPPTHKAGYEKIRQTCLRALQDGLTHAWVDTCCIDKSSSNELSESINTMFRWYQMATVCYAYLEDVGRLLAKDDQASALAKSVWFERGWTLQELLAPGRLVFYSSDWSLIGNREEFLDTIHQRTGIDPQFLTFDQSEGHHIHEASVAERMSWASSRHTTRSEDVAYCMLGILGISMPLLYGEGEAAFIRLQEELIKHSDDQTILAWDIPQHDKIDNPGASEAASKASYKGILAKSPAGFAGRGKLIPRQGNYNATSFSVTNKGLNIEVPFCITNSHGVYLMLLCGPKDDPTVMIALPLCEIRGNQYARGMAQPTNISYDEWRHWSPRRVHLLVRPISLALDRGFEDGGIWIRHTPDDLEFGDVVPQDRWSLQHRIVGMPISRGILNAIEPTASFVLRAPGKDGLPVIRVSLEAIFLPRFITWTLGISPFRASYTIVPTPSGGNTTQSTDQTIAGTRHVSRASYIRLADDSLLYAKMTHQSVLGKEFLIVDIKATRDPTQKAWVLLRHSCVDLLINPLCFPTDMPTVNKWRDTFVIRWFLMCLAILSVLILLVVVDKVAPGSVYMLPFHNWRNMIRVMTWKQRMLRSGSNVIRPFRPAYSILTSPDQTVNYFFIAYGSYILYFGVLGAQLSIPLELKLLVFGAWVITVLVTDWVPWAYWIRLALWGFVYGYLYRWGAIRRRVLPQNQQHNQLRREQDQMLKQIVVGTVTITYMVVVICYFIISSY